MFEEFESEEECHGFCPGFALKQHYPKTGRTMLSVSNELVADVGLAAVGAKYWIKLVKGKRYCSKTHIRFSSVTKFNTKRAILSEYAIKVQERTL
ncbi:hypothetical protein AVEN_238396-1 [Araneus ventricosus]|uniref:Uncharacterized protein n=1 Tax=Araneus ventricosus TaxID=182803 RepID=A0A4Y2DME0_ARAVE|nr:hypothetical protein AVEN_238396-1 [Araneus ventricosus]